jgi:hypothetical protein
VSQNNFKDFDDKDSRRAKRSQQKKNRKKQNPKDLLRALDYEDDESLYTKTEKFHNK